MLDLDSIRCDGCGRVFRGGWVRAYVRVCWHSFWHPECWR
jgi:hypothetical protein